MTRRTTVPSVACPPKPSGGSGFGRAGFARHGRRLTGWTRTLLLSSLPVLACLALQQFSVAAAYAAAIRGVVYEDENRGGERDGTEPGLAAVSVVLIGNDGFVRRVTSSGPDGTFAFEGLPAGDYLLGLPEVPGYRASLPNDVGESPPLAEFPYGGKRYSSPPLLIPNAVLGYLSGREPLYMGLGDSVGFGFNDCGSQNGEFGYFEPIGERLSRAVPGAFSGDKQAIPGDSSADLLNPDIDPPNLANDVFYAVDEQPQLVTLSIGGNDYRDAITEADLAAASAVARQNIQEILATLVSELPTTDIEINTTIDGGEGLDPVRTRWTQVMVRFLRELAWAQQRRVVIGEVFPDFAHDEQGQIKGEPDLFCTYFGLVDQHPRNLGYDLYEEKLWQSLGGFSLTEEQERDDVNFGFVREFATVAAARSVVFSGDVAEAQEAIEEDGVGALVEPDGGELRLEDFGNGGAPDGYELVQAIVQVTYRTTGAPIDDQYRFEASIDGSFSPPGPTVDTWNTIIPLVGAAGNAGSVRLPFADQPNFRTVSAPLFLGSPEDNQEFSLQFSDLSSLAVRLVTTAEGTPDPYQVEWDGAKVIAFARPLVGEETITASATSEGSPTTALAAYELDGCDSVEELRSLSGNAAVECWVDLSEQALLSSLDTLSLLTHTEPKVRRLAFDSRQHAAPPVAEELALWEQESDEGVRFAGARSFLWRQHALGTHFLLKLIAKRSQYAGSALAAFNDTQPAADVVLAALRGEDARLVAAGARVLAMRAEVAQAIEEPLLEQLRLLLSSGETEPAWWARLALASVDEPVALRGLGQLTARQQVEVLSASSLPVAAERLLALANHASVGAATRWLAALALCDPRREVELEWLRQLAKNSNQRVARLGASAVKALGLASEAEATLRDTKGQ